jgi:hypothetical protein
MLGVSLLYLIGIFMICYGSFKINDAAGFIVTGIFAVLLSAGFNRLIEMDNIKKDLKNK